MNIVHLSGNQPDRIINFCVGMIHIGEKIKKKSKELRVSASELAKRINTTKQNVYQIFKKKSIDTDLLRVISEALRYNFFDLYKEDLKSLVLEPDLQYTINSVKQISSKAVALQGQQVMILKKIGKHQFGQLFSLRDENFEDKEKSIVKYIDVLPQMYLRNEEKKQEFRQLKEQAKEETFRLKYCEQIPLREIMDIQYLDDHYQEKGLLHKN